MNCHVKLGLFVLRNCSSPVVTTCSVCGKQACKKHMSNKQKNVCLECWSNQYLSAHPITIEEIQKKPLPYLHGDRFFVFRRLVHQSSALHSPVQIRELFYFDDDTDFDFDWDDWDDFDYDGFEDFDEDFELDDQDDHLFDS